MRRPFGDIAPTPDEVTAALPGDDLVPHAAVVMDRAFDLPGRPDRAWPWFVQLGKDRAGWYLPTGVERLVPARRRALRRIDPDLQRLAVGDVVPDWGGRDATFEIVGLSAATGATPGHIVHRSRRGHMDVSWTIRLSAAGGHTRVHLRLRLGPVRRRRLAEYGGGLVDAVTVAGLAAGLRERMTG